MGEALDWFRRRICQAQGHDHDEAGELDCLLATLHRVRQGEIPDHLLDHAE